MPASVEPCFDTVRKSSPGRPFSYSPTVAKPLQSATRNSNVRPTTAAGQLLADRLVDDLLDDLLDDLRGGLRPARRRPGVGLASSFLAVDSGWPTLQLSR